MMDYTSEKDLTIIYHFLGGGARNKEIS